MLYEVALKGAYRKKRYTLGFVDMEKKPDIDTALNALGWHYHDTRACDHKSYMNKNENIIMDYQVSIRRFKP